MVTAEAIACGGDAPAPPWPASLADLSDALEDLDAEQPPFARSLPVPTVAPSVVTPMEMLAPAMRPLAAALAPKEAIVDCGGGGRCCPNSIAFALQCLGRFEGDGDTLRAVVVAHAATLAADNTLLSRPLNGRREEGLRAREYLCASMHSWPVEARKDRKVSWEAWLELMAINTTWGDEAFLAAAADCFLAEIEFRGVNAEGEIVRSGTLAPSPLHSAECKVVLALWVQQHYAAIVRVTDADLGTDDHLRGGLVGEPTAAEAADAFLRGMEQSLRPTPTCHPNSEAAGCESREALSATSAGSDPPRLNLAGANSSSRAPLTTRAEVRALLQSDHPPTVLVAMEFSGSLRAALESQGVITISADFRPCAQGGLHFQGDVREIVDLTRWRAIYFFPNCFQQLRADVECLPAKIRDGRAFWGCAMVLWCLCCPHADLVVVEQPDTIAYDYGVPDGVKIYEFRTSALGDPSDKFVRLAVRGALLPLSWDAGSARAVFERRKRKRPESDRSPYAFANSEERDRERSTCWANHPRTCLALASLLEQPRLSEPALSYDAEIHRFAAAWVAAGHPLPPGFDAPQGRPPSPRARLYQATRGRGHVTYTQQQTPPSASDGFRAGLMQPPTATNSPAGAGCSTPRSEEVAEAPEQPTDRPEKIPFLKIAGTRLLNAHHATEAASLLLFVCVVGQPLVYAHVNGFTVLGVASTTRMSRPACMAAIQQLVSAIVAVTCYAFMVGEYVRGARLFTAPVAATPAPSTVIRTPQDRRRALRLGGGFAWCTLLALRGTALEDAAARALLATNAFTGSTRHMADFSSATDASSPFSLGARPASYLTASPLISTRTHAEMTEVLASLIQDDQRLLDALDAFQEDELLSGWREIVKPLDLTDIPAGLLSALPSFDRDVFDTVPLTAIPEPVPTSWMPLPPRQAPAAPGFCPKHVGDLMLPETRQRVYDWLLHSLKDLTSIRDMLAAGHDPSTIPRDRPSALAVGQMELYEQARGRVWDCRPNTKAISDGGCCQVADFQAPVSTHLNLTFIDERLAGYPDQTLLANLLEGVRLDADVELQAVLIPHLTSLPLGFASVEKELRRLHSSGWYDFFADFPFWPMYLNGQGATARKLEPDRFRRTTEGGGPRQPTFDASGLRALSINEASFTHHIPQHFLSDERAEMTAWLRARGLLGLEHHDGQRKHSKWPKERKPQLAELMRDIAVLKRAAHVLAEPIYIFGDDAKDYFNQLAMASSELHKLGIVFLQREEDLGLTPPRHAPVHNDARLLFVSEKRLGFGTHGASNIAQRFSNALLDLFRDQMDEAEAEDQRWHQSPELNAWLATREAVQTATGIPCHHTRRYSRNTTSTARVCPQQRLYTTYMFTDDPIWIVVGVQRTIRALREWRKLTDSVGLIMAIPEKRSLGAWAKWLGILIIPALGLVAVPRDKTLRALMSINQVLDRGAPFHVYRSLCGLLEHLRAVNQQGRNVMHGLYAPHGSDGASRHGPSGHVVCDELMRKQLQRWITLLGSTCGASVTAALDKRELRLQPTTYYHICSDAMYEPGRAGIGGFCHGLYWSLEAPPETIPVLSIPILEFLGVVINFVVFGPTLKRLLAGNPHVVIVLRTDALTAALTLPAESQHSPLLIAAYHWLRGRPEFTDLASYCLIAHLFGDANPYSDCLSRGKWEEFFARCRQIGVKPIAMELPFPAYQVFDEMVSLARTRTHSSAPNPSLVTSMQHFRAGSFHQRRFNTSPRTPGVTAANVPPSPATGFTTRRFGERADERQAPKRARLSYREPINYDADPRSVLGLRLPAAFPARNAPTSLTRAGQHYARTRMQAIASGGARDMQLQAGLSHLMQMSDVVQESVDYGVNANTAQKDDRAWVFWERVCEAQGTNPLRTAQEVREHPERQAHLLAVLMLYAFSICVPTDRTRQFIKPRSALAYPLAIIRIFGRWGITMPGYKSLVAAMNGLMRLYVEYHGPHSLAPRRAEPMKFAMMRAIYNIPPNSTVGRWRWTDADHDVFTFRRLNVFLMHTAFRLGEIVAHRSGEIMYITRACVVWSVGGTLLTDPSPSQLHSLRAGLDYALVAPPRSKPDQWGEIHCPFPVTLTYDTASPNAAACLRDIELQRPCVGPLRHSTPLFADRGGNPYSHGFLASLLHAALTFLYGSSVASLYTFHSYRSGLATALHAAGVSDAMIQLICRWMCPESLHVYRRVGTQEHEGSIRKAAAADVDVLQSVNAPKVSADAGFAELVSQLQGPRGALAQREYEAVRSQVGDNRVADAARPAGRDAHGAAALTQPPRAMATPQPANPNPLTAGSMAFVPKECWPDAPCLEHGGTGWTVTLLTVTRHTAVVKFLHARAPSGAPYAPVRIQLQMLRALV